MNDIADLTQPHPDHSWQIEMDTDVGVDVDKNFQEKVAYDELLLSQVASGEKAPTIRIWRNQQCLVATTRESRKPGFNEACNLSALAAWPVAIRRSGGTCVPQGPGVINLAMVYPRPSTDIWSMEDGYELLCAPLQKLLASFDLKAQAGEVPGSFCDGKFNLQVSGRKLVGTSQRWKGNPAKAGSTILSHACLLVDLDLATATTSINQLYSRCGDTQQFDPHACTTLRECVNGPVQPFSAEFVDRVTERLSEIIMNNFSITGARQA